MTTMDQIHHIRQLYYEQGLNLTEIAAATNLNWKTVKKYVDMEDFNEVPSLPTSETKSESKLDSFKPLIDQWLEADKKAPRSSVTQQRECSKGFKKK